MPDSIHYDYYCVAFVDVLGQQEVFKSFNDEGLTDNHPKIIAIHKQTVMHVESLRSCFAKYFEGNQKEANGALVPEDKREMFKEMMRATVGTYRFSDCFLAFTSLRTDKYCSNSVSSVFSLLTACGAIMVLSLSARKPFRAAIDVGIGTTLTNGEVYGPISYKVYELESKVAQYPRIVIGSQLIEFLHLAFSGTKQFDAQTDEDIQVCKVLAERCLKFIVKDVDGHYILDYLGSDFISNFSSEPKSVSSYKEMITKAFEFVEEEYQIRQGQCDAKLASRYFLLLNYFRARVQKE
ncbi:MAG: hypothetical protein HGA87_02095 [Desulfobulbaceae bacterium]|nr:hypothetical protein [Desulfobulbaceae bacterium]